MEDHNSTSKLCATALLHFQVTFSYFLHQFQEQMDQEFVLEPISASAATCLDGDDVEPLSGKPFFHVIMSKSHVSMTHLPLPKKFVELLPEKASIPAILTRGSRSWEMKYCGNHITQRRLSKGWRTFVEDNTLNLGDVCIFELMSCEASLIKLKVQVLRGDFPSALLEKNVGADSVSE
ncbi:hypothetical protein vseg_009560 [Gypsophila vaccaria]